MKVTQITKAITSSELVEILKKIEKGTFSNILTETNVRMNKKNKLAEE
jgi:DNA-binding TFAR19-related protein (PDSD5 family)